MTDEARRDDWLGEVLQHGAAELSVESGIIPIGDGPSSRGSGDASPQTRRRWPGTWPARGPTP